MSENSEPLTDSEREAIAARAAYEEWFTAGNWRAGERTAFEAGWAAKIAHEAADHPGEVTNEQVYADLLKYQELGVIQYVLPTDPLGAVWHIGVGGQIQKLIGKGQAVAWLVGAAAVAGALAKQAGLKLESRGIR